MANLRISATDQIQKAHVALFSNLQKLEEKVASCQEGPNQLHRFLADLREMLVQHFRFEEQNGYMEGVRKHEPRLERSIQELLGEHLTLRKNLDSLVEKTRDAKEWVEPLREEIVQWIKDLHRHESRENLLIEEAFNMDLGPED